jgi:hypothetical protein
MIDRLADHGQVTLFWQTGPRLKKLGTQIAMVVQGFTLTTTPLAGLLLVLVGLEPFPGSALPAGVAFVPGGLTTCVLLLAVALLTKCDDRQPIITTEAMMVRTLAVEHIIRVSPHHPSSALLEKAKNLWRPQPDEIPGQAAMRVDPGPDIGLVTILKSFGGAAQIGQVKAERGIRGDADPIARNMPEQNRAG